MKVQKIIATMLLLALTALTITSCVSIPPLDIESFPDLNNSKEVSEAPTSQIEESTEPGFTERPKYTQIVNVTADRVVIAGTCEDGAVVTITKGKEPVSVQSVGGYFITEVTLATSGSNRLEMTAKVEDKEESTARIFYADYKATVSQRPDGLDVMVGLNSQLFLNKSYKEYNGENVLSTTEIKAFQTMLKDNYTSIQEKRIADLALLQTGVKKPDGMTDLEYLEMLRDIVRQDYTPVEVIYVMIPNAITLYPELVPEDMKTDTNTTRYQQLIKAFRDDADIKTKVIDMLPILQAHKDDGYNLFSRTYSNWSDYAAYFAYEELLKVIAEDYPVSSPRPLSDFNIVTKDVMGGDLAGYTYLDRTTARDTFTVLEPKFSYTFQTGDFYNGPDDFTFNLTNKAANALSSRREIKTSKAGYPSAVIYRDESATPIYNMLAEKFSTTIYFTMNSLTPRKVDLTHNKTKTGADYVIVFCTESSIDTLLASQMS